MTVRCCGVLQITTLQLELNDRSNEDTDYLFDAYHARSRADDRFLQSGELKASFFETA